jgi:ubiquinone/menaquinone biosynthesis C-methylase UbiE
MKIKASSIIDQQHESWNRFAAGWKKWDAVNMQFLQPVGEKIIEHLHLKSDNKVLDIASGTGEPGLSIAAITTQGSVTALDLSEAMLEIAKEHASERQLRNFETQAGDISSLDFADQSIDAISCRMGFMFFPDILGALSEMHRVLRDDCWVAASVWDIPQKNFWVTVTMGTIDEIMKLKPPPPDAPGMFRCTRPGFMREHLQRAGFRNITETEVSTGLRLDPETYWEMITEVGAPIVAALSQADSQTQEAIRQRVLEKIYAEFPEGNFYMGANAIIIAGQR